MHCWRAIRRIVRLAAIFATTMIILPFAAQSAEIVLGWDQPDDSRVTGYKIYYGELGTEYKNSPRNTNPSPHQTTILVSDLIEGQTYLFAVTSFDASGNESTFSEAISHTVPVNTDGTDLCPEDPAKTDPGQCGCGVADTDTDTDGVADCIDADDDNDGMPDIWEVANGLNPFVDDSAGDPDGDGRSNIKEYRAGTNPLQSDKNRPPKTPTLISPADLALNLESGIVLEANDFTDEDNDVHQATEWQVSARNDFSELVFGKEDKKNLTKVHLPQLILAANTSYYWRARYVDDLYATSGWSEVNTFTTGDWSNGAGNGGIADDNEVPEDLDLDKDNVPDKSQGDIKSIKVKNDIKLIGVKCPPNEGMIEYLESIDHFSIADEKGKPESLPFGLVNFRINVNQPGQTIRVTVYLSEPAAENARWFKYDTVEGWRDYSDHATISADRKSVEIELKDGGFGDADGVENGVIIDPSGLGIASFTEDGASDQKSGGGGGGGCFINSLF